MSKRVGVRCDGCPESESAIVTFSESVNGWAELATKPPLQIIAVVRIEVVAIAAPSWMRGRRIVSMAELVTQSAESARVCRIRAARVRP